MTLALVLGALLALVAAAVVGGQVGYVIGGVLVLGGALRLYATLR